jgi:YegS/Rv2252/BmrU family lipid kinase
LKPFVVVNPRSGGGAAGRTFGAIRSTIERSLGSVEVGTTDRPGHGIELAREAAKSGHPLVIALGGDGTIHEVTNGLVEAGTETELGVIGMGTGGDFRKTLGIEHRLDRYIDAIASGRQRTIDVGRFGGGGKARHHFVNILSVGMGGLVDRYVAGAPRLFGGKAAYFGATLKALLNARLGRVRCTYITADGKTDERLLVSFMIAVCNGQYFGGGMQVAPMASLDDGLLELVALGATSKLGFAMTSGGVYSGEHLSRPETVHLRGRSFKLELVNEDAREKYLLDVDGEPMGELPLEIECVPRALVVRA